MIMLYQGQTSSGKTYTMGTAASRLQEEGIIPRAVSKLFGLLHRDNSTRQSSIKVSFIEIYNEEVIDLLSPHPVSERPLITIREDPKGHIYWTGVCEMTVHSACDVLAYLQQGSRNRATGATDMNDKSSRSHAILTLTLQRRSDTGDNKGMMVTSKFHFVDLAGSERLKRTAAQGNRRKEGININSGLLALGNVISVLGNDRQQQQHVPYRDSKLTRLLQDSLGGNAATLMIACVSPAEYNLSETTNTLQYASRARHIKNKVQQVEEWMTTDNIELLRSMVGSLLKHHQHIGDDGTIPMDTEPSYQQQRLVIMDLQQKLETQRKELSATRRKYRLIEHELQQVKQHHHQTWNTDFLHIVEPVVEEYEKNIAALESQLAMARAALNHADREIEEQYNKVEKYEIVMDEQERLIQEYERKNSKQQQQQHDLEKELDTLRLRNHTLEMDLYQKSRKYQELQRHDDDYKRVSVSSTSSNSSSGSTLVGESDEKWREDRKALHEQVKRLQSNILALQTQADERDHAAETRIQRMSDKLQAVTKEKEELQAKLYENRNMDGVLSATSHSKRHIDLPETTSQYVALHDQYSDLTDRMQSAVDKLRAVVQSSRKSAVLMRHMADFERQLEKHKSKVLDAMLKLEVEFDEFFQQRNNDKIVFVICRAKHGLHDLSLTAVKLEEKVQQAELALTDRAIITTTPAMSTYTSLYS